MTPLEKVPGRIRRSRRNLTKGGRVRRIRPGNQIPGLLRLTTGDSGSEVI
jgi:hypothetical protein